MDSDESLDNGLSQTIFNLECELQQHHELRCNKYESKIVELNQFLQEAARKHHKLKEDFEYNLTLIRARDAEIERLEFNNKDHEGKFENLTAQIRNQQVQIDSLVAKEVEMQRKLELEKTNSKRSLEEFRENIERVRWSFEEEQRGYHREIESLQNEIHRLNAVREESLESQRRDLTATFEGIIKQRDDVHANEASDVSNTVMMLNNRFEQLSTENNRLKSESDASQRKCEALSEELSRKEEARRQLQWQLDDERASQRESEDVHAQKIQSLSLELDLFKQNAAKDILDLGAKFNKAQTETNRQKDYAAKLEQRLEEVRAMAQRDLTVLEQELEAGRAREREAQSARDELREERDTWQRRYQACKSEHDVLSARANALTVDGDSLERELQHTRAQLADREKKLATLQQEYDDCRAEFRQRGDEAMHDLMEQLGELKAGSYAETLQLKRKHESEMETWKAQLEEEGKRRISELEKRHEQEMLTLQKRAVEAESALHQSQHQLQEMKSKYEEESIERRAVQARLDMTESLSNTRRSNANNGNNGGGNYQYHHMPESPGGLSDMPSLPAFSLPGSPNLSFLPHHHDQQPHQQQRNQANRGGGRRLDAEESVRQKYDLRYSGDEDREYEYDGEGKEVEGQQQHQRFADQYHAATEAENAHLKRQVHEIERQVKDLARNIHGQDSQQRGEAEAKQNHNPQHHLAHHQHHPASSQQYSQPIIPPAHPSLSSGQSQILGLLEQINALKLAKLKAATGVGEGSSESISLPSGVTSSLAPPVVGGYYPYAAGGAYFPPPPPPSAYFPGVPPPPPQQVSHYQFPVPHHQASAGNPWDHPQPPVAHPPSHYPQHGEEEDEVSELSAFPLLNQHQQHYQQPYHHPSTTAGHPPTRRASDSAIPRSVNQSAHHKTTIPASATSTAPSEATAGGMHVDGVSTRFLLGASGGGGSSSSSGGPNSVPSSPARAPSASVVPSKNSSRMLPSQQEALKRIQDSGKRNSLYVGPVKSSTTAASASTSSSGTTNKKVLNYAQFVGKSP